LNEQLTAIREIFGQNSYDAFMVSNDVNRRYLSGFDGSAGTLLISQEKAYLVTDFRYIEQATVQAEDFEVKKRGDDLHQSMAQLLAECGWSKIAFESKQVSYAEYIEMKDKLGVELIPLDGAVEKLRMIKNKGELEILRSGAHELDNAFSYICTRLRPGVTEKEIDLELEFYLRRNGAEAASFRFIVASGERGALPHGAATTKQLAHGELVTIDFGAVYNGYATDMTRTVAIGSTDQRQREIYGIVEKARSAAAAFVKPGIKANEADQVARDIIEKAGYGSYFGHGLGHGVGLETHEQPTLNPRSTTVLEPGMVVTVEPGIYLPGWGGVRIEDMVLVTADGAELLTRSPRELITINY
jgi:Xaa-Pro aminopeptidase